MALTGIYLDGTSVLPLVAPAMTLTFWFAGLAGWRRFRGLAELRGFRQRNLALSLGLAPCLALSLVGSPEAGLLPPLLTGLLAGLTFLTFATAAPDKTGPWHNPKLRLPATVLALAAPTLLAFMITRPELVVVASAFAMLLRHQAGAAALAETAQIERASLRHKILSLEAELRLEQRSSGDIGDDKVKKAS